MNKTVEIPEHGVVWIASYPKSGNTWMRLLLGNYFYGTPDKPFTINTIQHIIRSDVSKDLYRNVCEERGWDMVQAMSDIHRRAFFIQRYVEQTQGTVFLKTHSCVHAVEGIHYFSPAFTKSFIYVVRDPRDVLCSYARHIGQDIDATFESMASDKAAIGGEGDKLELLSSWDNHVRSFLALNFPKIIIRYEDLLADTRGILEQIIKQLKLKLDMAQLDFAVEHSSFAVLQGQEEEEGFKEQSDKNDQFFNKGQAGRWKEELTERQVRAVEERFEPVMKKLGYL